ncbi:MAG TPA: hypothetical protein VFJ13_12335 [Paracoccaceae bacterium]|nr:hypothetical protein [Paracoccaceae bacterium]
MKHGLVNRVADWPYSSFHRDVRRGIVPADWAGDAVDGDFGEPADAARPNRDRMIRRLPRTHL